ncbi:trypsin-like peptidase domain-containing protein [Methanobacterium sp.]|uniref:trypsin-like peptidase domain-containing protein n=1 Tax=Methanobacterium sp. TaxID=2164 RepID=UPI003C789E55
MGLIKKLILSVIIIVVAILFLIAAQSTIGNYDYSQSSSLTSQTANSAVYIQNGVTGVVTINDPFLHRTARIDVIYDPLDTGSGFIVNKNGYVITALHVIGDLDSLNKQTLKIMDSNDVNRYVERAAVKGYISEYNPELSSEVAANTSTNPDKINSNITTDFLIQKNLIVVQSSKQVIKVNLPGSQSTPLNATLVDTGNPSTDEDVALLKINTPVTNLHALAVNSKRPVIFEGLHIYGYPGLDNAENSFTNPSNIKPESSSGLLTSEVYKNGTDSDKFDINSIYENIANWFMLITDPGTNNNGNNTLYYGTSAPTTQGYSGGPVVDSHNNVLGIIIFSIESNSVFKQQIRFTSSLFLSSQYIIQLCKKNHIPIKVVNT